MPSLGATNNVIQFHNVGHSDGRVRPLDPALHPFPVVYIVRDIPRLHR